MNEVVGPNAHTVRLLCFITREDVWPFKPHLGMSLALSAAGFWWPFGWVWLEGVSHGEAKEFARSFRQADFPLGCKEQA